MAVSVQTLQKIDRWFGPPAQVLLQPVRWFGRRAPESTERILVVKFWGLGSITLLGPAVRVLRKRFPGAAIDLLTLSGNANYARRLGAFDEILSFQLGSNLPSMPYEIIRTLLRVRARNYDRLYDFEFLTHFSALIAKLSKAAWTSGYSSPDVWRGGFFDEETPFNRYWHVARNARSLAGGENGFEVTLPELIGPTPSAEGRAEADRALADGPVNPNRPIIVVNVNAGKLALERRWPVEHFITFLNGLSGHTRESLRFGLRPGDVRIVMTGSPDERDYVESIRLKTTDPDRLDNFAGGLSMDGFLGLLDRAAVVVSNDSGPLHIAAAMNRPVVALFGPETPVMYAPLSTHKFIFYKPPACSPCINVHDNKLATCHLGFPLCLERIAPDEVLNAVENLLNVTGARRSTKASARESQ
ncbi:MAG: glycosyltransferase family 9 protein [Planctomycetota bacterium]